MVMVGEGSRAMVARLMTNVCRFAERKELFMGQRYSTQPVTAGDERDGSVALQPTSQKRDVGNPFLRLGVRLMRK